MIAALVFLFWAWVAMAAFSAIGMALGKSFAFADRITLALLEYKPTPKAVPVKYRVFAAGHDFPKDYLKKNLTV